MDQGVADAAELQELLRRTRRRVWVRALLGRRQGGRAQLHYALVIVGPRPAEWEERLWRFEDCAFVATEIAARQFATACEPGSPRELRLGPVRAAVELADGSFNWRREPTLGRFSRLRLPWPARSFEPLLANRDGVQLPSGFLVGRDSPSFPAASGAFNAFFYDDFHVSGATNPVLGRMEVCLIDSRARIRRVRVRPTRLDVWVGGTGLRGVVLELGGATDRTHVVLRLPGKVSLQLPRGLPDEAWVWLKQGTDWLDYRALSGWGVYRSSDVEVEVPHDPAAELSSLASQGEGQRLEYKEKLPETDREKRNAFKTVVAFANGVGGTVLFGVDDDGEVVGLRGTPAEERRRLSDLLRDLVQPTPRHRIDEARLEGKRVLLLRIEENSDALHALILNRNRPEYFVRRDATTYYARPEELVALLQSIATSTGSGPASLPRGRRGALAVSR